MSIKGQMLGNELIISCLMRGVALNLVSKVGALILLTSGHLELANVSPGPLPLQV